VHCQFSLIVKSGGGTTPDSIFFQLRVTPLSEVICKFYVSDTHSDRARQKTAIFCQRFAAKYGHIVLIKLTHVRTCLPRAK
jgi:hypothetical protein